MPATRPTVRSNRLKAAIASGRRALGFHMSAAMPDVIEQLGNLAFEIVYLDGEHGRFDLDGIENCCRAAELYDLTVIARVPHIDANLISQYLNLGVQGIIVPHVSRRADMQAVVDACFFEPTGHRPGGGSRSNRFWHAADDLPAAMAALNDNITVSVQIESREAVDNLEDILDVGHVDYFTVGKSDLAQSYGFPRIKGPAPKALTAIVDGVEQRIRARGGRLKDDVMTLGRVRDFIMDGGKRFVAAQGEKHGA